MSQPKRPRPSLNDTTTNELIAAQEAVEEAYDKLGKSLAALRRAIDERKSSASPSQQPQTPAAPRKDRR